jgi:alpha-tubulin suppressor-like RCC1 family protein
MTERMALLALLGGLAGCALDWPPPLGGQAAGGGSASSAAGGAGESVGSAGAGGGGGEAGSGGTGGSAAGGAEGGSGGTGGSAGGGGAARCVSPGDRFTCARKGDGTAWCWGYDTFGKLGIGGLGTQKSPTQLTALGTSVVEISAGRHHACARTTDGSAWCWGSNDAGQLGDGTSGAGTDKSVPTKVAMLDSTVAQVVAAWNHSCARKGDGTLWCWGANGRGQLGDGTLSGKSTPVQVAALGASVAHVAAGVEYSCAIDKSGALWCWGAPVDDNPTPVHVASLGNAVAEVAAGYAHLCARKQDGSLWCWGYNEFGQVGDGTTMNKSMPVQVQALGTAVAALAPAAMASHTCVYKKDGTLVCWGYNDLGQLGDGTTVNKPQPVPVSGIGATIETAVGGHHTCARASDGSLSCWGEGIALGDGVGVDSPVPVKVALSCL